MEGAKKMFALRNSNYDGKGGVHYAGCNWYKGENLAEMRTYKTEAHAKATNEFKHYNYEVVPVLVTITVLKA